MADRRDYPGRGRCAGRRSLRHPAGLSTGLLACVLAAVIPAACNEPDGETVAVTEAGRGYEIRQLPSEVLELEGAAGSLNDLLRTVERALAESDTTRLHDLMIDEREYRDILFPAFPAAHPPINAGFETLWVLQYPDSFRGMHRLLGLYGGRDVRVTAIRFDEPDQDFVNFVLHEDSHVDLTVDGKSLKDVRLFGSVIRVEDQWKVLTYPDDPEIPG